MTENLFILAGQSNMQGAAPLADAPAPHPDVQCFSSAGRWEPAAEPLHRLWESFTPVHQRLMRRGLPPEQQARGDAEHAAVAKSARQAGQGGFGPGLAFGRALAEITDRHIGLIPCAHGGTSLEQWWHDKRTPDDLYGAMLERVRRAGGKVRALLWYQGESDAGQTGDQASTYGERLAEWITAVRRDLNAPELLAIIVQLATAVRRPPERPAPVLDRGWTQVRQAQLDLPRRVPHTACVSAIDLSLYDTIHIDGPSQNRLGRRLALAFSRLAQGIVNPVPVPVAVEPARHPHPQLGLLRVRYVGLTDGIAPTHGIRGFSLRTVEGSPHPDIWVIQAAADPIDPKAILVTLNQPFTGPGQLAYGCGEAPICNAVDHSDLALPGFIRNLNPEI